MDFIIVLLFSYLSGSIPYGLLLTKIFYKQDIRKVGSGNIGATNVLRTGNKFLAIITLLLDVLKGYMPVILTIKLFPELVGLSCIFVFIGHIFSIWLKFKGGKGVATYLGAITALSIELSILFIFTWIVVSLIFKYSSLSSMFSAFTVFVVSSIRDIASPIIGELLKQNQYLNSNSIIEKKILLFIFFILIIFTHRKNISNLINKTEKKIKI
tara:strand:+ start:1296 stop:1931 length:636 start_codon:yes stop_codon:yes gene_type:complete